MAGKKYIIFTVVLIILGTVYFIYGTKKYDGKKDFEQTKNSNIVKTNEDLTFLIKKSKAQKHSKTIEMFGNVDQDATTVYAPMPSVVQSVVKEGTVLTKNSSVLTFVNGVSKPMPFNGIVLDMFVKKGDDIKAGDKLFIAIPSDKRDTKINIDVPIAYASHVFENEPVIIIYNDEKYSGKISYVGMSSNNGIIKAVAKADSSSIPHNAVVKVNVEVANYETHFVPKTAVIIFENKTSIKVIKDDNSVQEKIVEIIDENQDGFYISNLNDEERIILRNPYYATNGKKYNYTTDV